MIDSVKEFAEAFTSRIRSPVFGSIFLALAVWNWRALALLLFSEHLVEKRIETFQNGLSFGDFIFPVIVGIVYALLSPWVTLAASIGISKPVNISRQQSDIWAAKRVQKKTDLINLLTIQAEAELKQETAEAEVAAKKHRVELEEREAALKQRELDLTEQSEATKQYAQAEAHKLRQREQEVLDQARADAAAKEIENIDIRENVQRRLDSVRAESELPIGLISEALNRTEKTILAIAFHGNGIIIEKDGAWTNVSPLKGDGEYTESNERIQNAVIKLDHSGLIFRKKSKNNIYKISNIGSRVASLN